eukprot:CAMPEP_0202493036 /NCGR_PEP_ID=MMETSP1361-20130828/9521_1 /ASSEMBLY_ACC=CAM_ASM_000849 /TAXON_ID=210615 /ORGANISM="Staurosira complex sp., Strain CCMP2646" /LENGTH=131 /DNA_ID=CAMNT_0049123299 /DNA_START=1108 /DNA_END=1500 /DNA_ORIENTATION=-
MGSGQSVPCVAPLYSQSPVSILECMDSNGGGTCIDPVKYSLFQQHQDAEMKRIASIMRKTSNNKRHVAEEEETLPPAKRRRNRNKSMLEYIDENGILRAIPLKQSPWYIQYVSNPNFSSDSTIHLSFATTI